MRRLVGICSVCRIPVHAQSSKIAGEGVPFDYDGIWHIDPVPQAGVPLYDLRTQPISTVKKSE
jgi:hypothetical protein